MLLHNIIWDARANLCVLQLAYVSIALDVSIEGAEKKSIQVPKKLQATVCRQTE